MILNSKGLTCILLLVNQISDLDWWSNCIIAPENFLSQRAKSSHAIVANRAQKPHTEERERLATGSGGGGDDGGGGRETRTPHSRSWPKSERLNTSSKRKSETEWLTGAGEEEKEKRPRYNEQEREEKKRRRPSSSRWTMKEAMVVKQKKEKMVVAMLVVVGEPASPPVHPRVQCSSALWPGC